jgi:hypothetical protein
MQESVTRSPSDRYVSRILDQASITQYNEVNESGCRLFPKLDSVWKPIGYEGGCSFVVLYDLFICTFH